MKFARFRRRSLIVFLLLAAWIVVWAFGAEFGLAIPFGVFVVGAFLLVAVNIFLLVALLREVRADATQVLAAHEGDVAFPSGVTSWPGADRDERESVIVVVGDERGLSFRDHDDREVLLVPADEIMSLELAPLAPRSPVRPFRVTTIDGRTFDFTGPLRPDAQVDAVVALRQALGRSAG